MLAQEIIYQKLSQSYISLLNQQVTNGKMGKTDTTLDCNVALAYGLIVIYPWLDEDELDDWRDRVEDVCDCDLPCVNCNGAGDSTDYDPATMLWTASDIRCEEVETTWIADPATVICQDDGITTTIKPETTTFPQFSTTQAQPAPCKRKVNFIYSTNSSGPAEIPYTYINCDGIQINGVFRKGEENCLDYISGTLRPTVPGQEAWFNPGQFSIGVYRC